MLSQMAKFHTFHTFLWLSSILFWVCVCVCVLVAWSCPTLCDPMDCSPPASSVCGILQVRILEWVAIPFSRGSSQPRDQTRVSCISRTGRWILYHQPHLGPPPLFSVVVFIFRAFTTTWDCNIFLICCLFSTSPDMYIPRGQVFFPLFCSLTYTMLLGQHLAHSRCSIHANRMEERWFQPVLPVTQEEAVLASRLQVRKLRLGGSEGAAFIFLFELSGMWDLSSLARDQTRAPCITSSES